MTALHAKVPLTIHDPSSSVLNASLRRLDKLLERDVSKSRISKEDGQAARERVRGVQGDGTGEGSLAGHVDLVIEVCSLVLDGLMGVGVMGVGVDRHIRQYQRFPT